MIRAVIPGRAVGRVRAPPSKSYTHRALVAGFLSGRPVEILAPLDSEDTRATAAGLAQLGAEFRRGAYRWTIRRGPIRRTGVIRIDCGESGTTLRFLTAVAALLDRPVRFVGRGRLPERPMEALFRPLRALGAEITRPTSGRSLPFTIRGPLRAGRVAISGRDSSQPISALLLALSSLKERSEIRLNGDDVVSAPYIDATLAWLRRGGQPIRASRRRFTIPEGGRWAASTVRVPADASSASYLWAAAVASRGRVTVEGIDRRWPQADLAILDVLSRMGARVSDGAQSITVAGTLTRGIRADLTASPDLYPLVGVLASLVPNGSSQLSNVPQLRHKESDRFVETERLVRAVGAGVTRNRGALVIHGTGRPLALRASRFSDHRLVMSAAIAALAAAKPSRIGDARAVRKSFPGFWATLARVQGRGPGR